MRRTVLTHLLFFVVCHAFRDRENHQHVIALRNAHREKVRQNIRTGNLPLGKTLNEIRSRISPYPQIGNDENLALKRNSISNSQNRLHLYTGPQRTDKSNRWFEQEKIQNHPRGPRYSPYLYLRENRKKTSSDCPRRYYPGYYHVLRGSSRLNDPNCLPTVSPEESPCEIAGSVLMTAKKLSNSFWDT